ncbi:unnamed protein product, partial [Staurois parvus]
MDQRDRANAHCFGWLCTSQPSKATQHTVNPLIAPDVNPFLPSAISTVLVLSFSTDHCIGVTGDVSDTKSVPLSVRMPATVPQSHYNSLIAANTSKNK